ncbi:MAG: glycosyltransferase [Chitinophagaceae bacterium]
MSDKKLHIVLIGNYHKDHQRSMNLFLQMLFDGYSAAGHKVSVWLPTECFGKLSSNTLSGYGKWLAYIDKYVIFPLVLRIKRLLPSYRNSDIRFHICDHSNAVYISHLPKDKTLITCHDVLAIKGAFGDKSAYCDASKAGVVLQKWILKSLQKAQKIATVSQTTLKQLNELSIGKSLPNAQWQVVLNAFNEPFVELSLKDSVAIIDGADLHLEAGFILHVGSDLPRKNRKLLIKLLNKLKDEWYGSVVLAGQALDSEIITLIKQYGLENRVVNVVNPDFKLLQALYSTCDAFVFPSYSEGFGWPVIEAQACGACVLASNHPAIMEVGGDAALYADADDVIQFAENFKAVLKKDCQVDLKQKSIINCKRFDKSNMIDNYLNIIKN